MVCLIYQAIKSVEYVANWRGIRSQWYGRDIVETVHRRSIHTGEHTFPSQGMRYVILVCTYAVIESVDQVVSVMIIESYLKHLSQGILHRIYFCVHQYLNCQSNFKLS